MAKPKKIIVPGIEYFYWKYEMQTKMKHQVLAEYFKNWALILGAYSKVYYFDCFGGCGAYLDEYGVECLGSPFLIEDIAIELKKTNNRDIVVLVSEPEKDNYENLIKIKQDKHNNYANLHITNSTFEYIIHHNWTKNIYMKYPTFFFLDPFGFSLKISDILDIMRYPRNEMIINFMFDYINRFIGDDTIADKFDELFGCPDWRKARDLIGEQRERYIIELYRSQLKKVSKYVFAFRMSYPNRDRTYYYLIHATNNLKGCTIMKSAFASQNYGRVEYLGYRQNELSLFDLKEYKSGEIEEYLVKRYKKGCEVRFNDIVDDVIDNAFYLESDIRSALKNMRTEGKVSSEAVTSKTNRGLSGDDIIMFI